MFIKSFFLLLFFCLHLHAKDIKAHALIDAAWYGDLEKIQELLDNGEDVNSRNESGETALHWSAYHSRTDVMQFLIEREADVNAKDKFGRTPLMVAVSIDSGEEIELINFLLMKGADPNLRDQWNNTALHIAAGVGSPEVIKALLEKGASTKILNNSGETPLQIAEKHKHLELFHQ